MTDTNAEVNKRPRQQGNRMQLWVFWYTPGGRGCTLQAYISVSFVGSVKPRSNPLQQLKASVWCQLPNLGLSLPNCISQGLGSCPQLDNQILPLYPDTPLQHFERSYEQNWAYFSTSTSHLPMSFESVTWQGKMMAISMLLKIRFVIVWRDLRVLCALALPAPLELLS